MNLQGWAETLWQSIWVLLPGLDTLIDTLINLAAPLLLGIYQYAGHTIESGNQGLKFSLGRAVKVCEPGFYPLVPYLQTMREVPARARTLNPPTQRVVTRQGYVYAVDASLTWRIVDIRRALIEVKDLERALRDLFAVGVQEVVAAATTEEVRHSETLDARLTERLAAQAERWGVHVEEAGFVTLAPTEETLRITQLDAVVAARSEAGQRLQEGGVTERVSLGMLGMRAQLISQREHRRQLEWAARWRLRRPQRTVAARRQGTTLAVSKSEPVSLLPDGTSSPAASR